MFQSSNSINKPSMVTKMFFTKILSKFVWRCDIIDWCPKSTLSVKAFGLSYNYMILLIYWHCLKWFYSIWRMLGIRILISFITFVISLFFVLIQLGKVVNRSFNLLILKNIFYIVNFSVLWLMFSLDYLIRLIF